MGEAKQRKASDPHYGKVPKIKPVRGIVVSPPMTISGNSIHGLSSDLDPVSLRMWLLFWDKLVWPTGGPIHFEESSDVAYLMREGVVTRPAYNLPGNIEQGLVQSYIKAFDERERAEPGCWALAQGDKAIQILGQHLPNTRDILVRLHQAVPIPADDVPFAEILEFKERRLPELYRFRHEIEQLYTTIRNSEDKALALNLGVERIHEACTDLIKVNKEWSFGAVLSSFDFSITPTQWVGAFAGFIGGQTFNLDTASSLLYGTVGAAISFTPAIGKRFVENKSNPYRYAYLAHQELRF